MKGGGLHHIKGHVQGEGYTSEEFSLSHPNFDLLGQGQGPCRHTVDRSVDLRLEVEVEDFVPLPLIEEE